MIHAADRRRWCLLVIALVGLLMVCALSWGQTPELARWAVCRQPSHGASCTVIATGPGRSYLLGCGHAYRGNDRSKRIRLDLPHPAPGPAQPAQPRVLAVDYQADLSLIEIQVGPLPYVAPVAPEGWQLSRQLLSCGYDEMALPGQYRPAEPLKVQGDLLLTRQRPWHGRSGGGLIDERGGYLVGVCSGYSGPRNHQEIWAGAEGIYVNHATIVRFLRRWQSGGSLSDSEKQPLRAPPTGPACPT